MKTKTIHAERPVGIYSGFPIRFPFGMPGFPELRRCELIYDKEELPFLWLQATEGCDFSFIVVEPWGLIPNYQMEMASEDAAFLGVENPDELFLLNIVTVPSAVPRKITVNLVAPLAVNLHTGIGRQVILKNHRQLSTRHVLLDESDSTLVEI